MQCIKNITIQLLYITYIFILLSRGHICFYSVMLMAIWLVHVSRECWGTEQL